MTHYLNEYDKKTAAWLRNLIKCGHLPPGEVDERSIEDVTPGDLAGYTQCHFFAGIGGWPLALQLAGWPADRPIWTGSCPCQPFSAAGKGAGFDDQRHLWPSWYHLIRECRPTTIFGEQVASKAAEPWIDLVHADLEGVGYAFGCVPFPAAGVGAPHIRDRTYWVAHADSSAGRQGRSDVRGRADRGDAQSRAGLGSGILLDGLADADRDRFQSRREIRPVRTELHAQHGGTAGWLGNASGPGLRISGRPSADKPGQPSDGTLRTEALAVSGPVNGVWSDADWLGCRDGKWRPVEPGTFPLAHGLPARVGRLRGYGNAIVPQQAAAFVRAMM